MKKKQPAWAIVRVSTQPTTEQNVTIKGVYESEEAAIEALNDVENSHSGGSKYFISHTRFYRNESSTKHETHIPAREQNFLRHIPEPLEPNIISSELNLIKIFAERLRSSEKSDFVPLLSRLAEQFVATAIGGKVSERSSSVDDVISKEGATIDVKTVFLRENSHRAPSFSIRTENLTDWYGIVAFSEAFDLRGAWLIPRDIMLLHVRQQKNKIPTVRITESLIGSPLSKQIYPPQANSEGMTFQIAPRPNS